MKKMMLAVAIVCAAAITQAATATWGSGALKTASSAAGGWSGTTVLTAGADVTMRIFLIDQTTYESLSTKSQADLYAAYNSNTADMTGINQNSSTKARTAAISISQTTPPDNQQWAVVIATYTDATYGDMYIAKAVANTFNSVSHAGSAANIISGVGNWQAVPEPTSGLLLLLGMAGLALRRRHA